MANINLLPWREQARTQRHRAFITKLLTVSLLFTTLLGYWYWYHLDLIHYQKQRNAFLLTELQQISQELQTIQQLEKAQQDLIARMQIVNHLQSSRTLSVRLLDTLVNMLPEGIQLTELAQSGNIITLTGHAESNARISTLMRRIESSDWLEKPELLVIEQGKQGPSNTGINDFRLSMQQVGISPKEDEQ